MTKYQSLLMALVSLPLCVLESWGLKKCKPDCSLKYTDLTEVVLQQGFFQGGGGGGYSQLCYFNI